MADSAQITPSAVSSCRPRCPGLPTSGCSARACGAQPRPRSSDCPTPSRISSIPLTRAPLPTPEQALAELGPGPLPDDVMMRETGEWARAIIGTPTHVRDTLVDIASVLHIDEVMLVTVVYDHRARMRSHELLADAFNLQ